VTTSATCFDTANQRNTQLCCGGCIPSTSNPVSFFSVLDVFQFGQPILAIPNRTLRTKLVRVARNWVFDIIPEQLSEILQDSAVQAWFQKHEFPLQYTPMAIQMPREIALLTSRSLWDSIAVGINRSYDRSIFDGELPLTRPAIKRISISIQTDRIPLASAVSQAGLTEVADSIRTIVSELVHAPARGETDVNNNSKLQKILQWMDSPPSLRCRSVSGTNVAFTHIYLYTYIW
jgi:hypothetical protein